MVDECKSAQFFSSETGWDRAFENGQTCFAAERFNRQRIPLTPVGVAVALVLATAAMANPVVQIQARQQYQHNEPGTQVVTAFDDVRFQIALFRTEEQDNTQVGKKLETIRWDASAPVDGKFNPGLAGPKYLAEFRDIGIDLDKGEPAALAKQVASSPLRKELLAALDHWAEIASDQKLQTHLLQVVRLADPDPWRDQVRDVKTWGDRNKLLALAQQANPGQQSPPLLILLSGQLAKHGSQAEATKLLRKALLHHPRDFWLYFHLGDLTNDPAEKAGYYLAALALNPACVVVHNNYGVVLQSQGKLDAASEHFRKAMELDPKFAPPYGNLGLILKAKGDLVKAVAVLKIAIALNPKDAGAYFHLGNILRDVKGLDEAAAYLHKTIELDPKYPFAFLSLGLVLYDKKDIDGAINCFKKSLAVDPPTDVRPHFHLGLALRAKGDVPGAIACFEKVLHINPKHAEARKNLEALQKQKQ